MKKKFLILALILIFSALLRLYRISDYPALNADEAAIAYNAYSLLQTGRDEHGNSWPFEFQSFNDYKPGGYFYLALPSIKIFGLTEFAVRLPNILLGIFSIFLIYSLAKQIFQDERIAQIAALVLAISPWHIHFSRGAWEVNAATTFFLLGSVLFLKNRLSLSIISFIFATYTYHSMRLMVPIFIFGLIICKIVEIKRNKKLILNFFLLILLLLPLTKSLLAKNASARFAGVGLTADRGPLDRAEELRSQHSNWNNPLSRLLHNRYFEYSLRFADNYTRHFSGNFLFITGDEIQRNKIPNMGLLYFFEIATLPLGFYYLLKHPSKVRLIWLWLIIAPIASALTFQSPHALRSQNMVVPFTLISSLGLYYFFKNRFLLIPGAIFIIWNLSFYLHQYYSHLSIQYPFSSQYGFKELVSYIQPRIGDYDQIYITTRYDQPYILTLFYLEYPPDQFQLAHTLTPRDSYGFSTVPGFDKFIFGSPNWDDIPPKSLVAVSPEESRQELESIMTINFPNGTPAFKIYSI